MQFQRKIILASQSPRRKQLLEWAEIPFEVMVSDADESFPAAMPVGEIATFIARQKAQAIYHQYEEAKHAIIIAADTIVVIDGQVLGKPVDEKDACRMIELLQGKAHEVITGVVILHPQKTIEFADCTTVNFHPLSKEQINFYIKKYQPFDKAGSYAIQEWIGVVGIQSIQGDFYNVMGLPVSRVVQSLMQLPA
ncbi:MAG: hypothetical protein RLY16_1802 [Bacteroidota bacterium]|jgi:septum formation protein